LHQSRAARHRHRREDAAPSQGPAAPGPERGSVLPRRGDRLVPRRPTGGSRRQPTPEETEDNSCQSQHLQHRTPSVAPRRGKLLVPGARGAWLQLRLLLVVCTGQSRCRHPCPPARSVPRLLLVLLFLLLLLSLAGLPRMLGPLASWLSPIAVRVRAVRVRLGGLLILVLLLLLLLLANEGKQIKSLAGGKAVTGAQQDSEAPCATSPGFTPTAAAPGRGRQRPEQRRGSKCKSQPENSWSNHQEAWPSLHGRSLLCYLFFINRGWQGEAFLPTKGVSSAGSWGGAPCPPPHASSRRTQPSDASELPAAVPG